MEFFAQSKDGGCFRQYLVGILLTCALFDASHGNPHSKPYIPFRTDPYEQPISKNEPGSFHSDRSDDFGKPPGKAILYEPEKAKEATECPLRFSLGVSKKSRNLGPGLGSSGLGIEQPPIIYPLLPWQGPGRQVLYTTQYEHLDMLTPSKGTPSVSSAFLEGLVEHLEFPLLFESSAFQTNPIIADANGDGILDAILTDYHGGLYAIGLQVGDPNSNHGTNHRYFLKAQVPRMYVRRQWMEAMVNETLGIDPYEAEKIAEAAEAQRKAAILDPPSEEKSYGGIHDERPHDPYHSYFEYSYGSGKHDHEPILRGVTANLLGQDHDHMEGLEERRSRKLDFPEERVIYDSFEEDKKNEKIIYDSFEEDANHQRVVYDSFEEDAKNQKVIYDSFEEDGSMNEKNHAVTNMMEEDHHRRLQQVEDEAAGDGEPLGDDPGFPDDVGWGGFADDLMNGGDDILGAGGGYIEDQGTGAPVAPNPEDGSEIKPDNENNEGIYVEGGEGDTSFVGPGDDDYPGSPTDDFRQYDDYARYHGGYDDFYSGKYSNLHDEYFDDKNYIRLPPHILCTPVLAELPKLYSETQVETETILFLAVSYYFDEDEYQGFYSYKRFENSDVGDETETKRGMYTANAIMAFHLGENPRWGRQEHLDLSGDHSAPVNMTVVGSVPMMEDNSKLGAFALSSPTIADIDGDGSLDILMGTSMGFLYVMDARNLYIREHFPIQLQYGIESRVLVEDVRGDTNLEIFVADVGGNVICLDHTGKKIWHRNLLYSVTNTHEQTQGTSEVLGSSPMVLGDVNGDGILDVVILLHIRTLGQGSSHFLFVLSADTGKDIEGGVFPMNIWTKSLHEHPDAEVGEDFVHTKLPPPLLVDMHEDQEYLTAYLRRNGTSWSKPLSSSKLREDDGKVPHGGTAGGLHIVQPLDTFLVIVEGGGSGCTQSIEIGDKISSMVQADDVHGTNKLDLIISTVSGKVITLESDAPFHPLNVWNNGELRSRTNGPVHGYSASQGIFVHDVSRRYRDIFGVYVPVTFEIFDNRPNIQNELDKRKYIVEMKTGTSKLVFHKSFAKTGVYTERLYIPFGPGHYQMSVILKTSHGLVYEDAFHIGYNVNYMDGFSLLLWLPLTIATIGVFLFGAKKNQHWDDDDFEGDKGKGILGNELPE